MLNVMRTLRGFCFLSIAAIASGSAYSGEYCWNETIQFVILHADGNIYFTTNKSCPGWCRVDPAWSADQRKQAYAMLLSAKAMDKPMTFHWSEHATACASQLPPNSYPVSMLL